MIEYLQLGHLIILYWIKLNINISEMMIPQHPNTNLLELGMKQIIQSSVYLDFIIFWTDSGLYCFILILYGSAYIAFEN